VPQADTQAAVLQARLLFFGEVAIFLPQTPNFAARLAFLCGPGWSFQGGMVCKTFIIT
jgi:hypothetical protein